MKKLILVSTALLTFAAFAQAADEQTQYAPGFRIEVTRMNPADDVQVIEMTPTEYSKVGSTVYNAEVTVPVFENSHTKYRYNVIYTSETGESVTATTNLQVERNFEDGEMKIVVAAWYDGTATKEYDKYKVSFSATPYVICDVNWTAMGYLKASETGEPQTTYFNVAKEKNYSAIRNVDLSKSTVNFIAGGNNQYQATFVEGTTPVRGKDTLYKAVFDYHKAAITFEEVDEIELEIDGCTPFVLPVAFIVPEGVTAYRYTGYADGVMTMDPVADGVVAANVPVILKADTKDVYTIKVQGEPVFEFVYSNPAKPGDRAWMANVAEDESDFYGVLQPRLAPTTGYVFDGAKFVKAEKNTIVGASQCYISLPDAEAEGVDAIAVELKSNDTPTGVEDIVFEMSEKEDGCAYNIFGQKVSDNYKGIVIKNGKKFMIR
ncbi:MAG: hypothetical protein K2M93_00210 [Muribaculaceae bacterium]|nr:hypothetical protein [Muribaculaceae bacterium]